MNQDFLDLLGALLAAEAQFMVVGAHAMAVHGVPRATGDIDIWIRPDPENADRVWQALLKFGAPVEGLEVSRSDLNAPDTVVQIGLPPRRIDLLTSLTGLVFEDAWPNRTAHRVNSLEVPFLGRTDLVRNKRALGRPKDLADLDSLEKRPEK
jgi:hypothetical protein